MKSKNRAEELFLQHQYGNAATAPEVNEYYYTQNMHHQFQGWDKNFDFVAGATMDSSRVEKADVIAYALKESGCTGENAVMIGDRLHDILGAKENGLDSIGVLFGYGSREELEDADADYIAETVADIIKFI